MSSLGRMWPLTKAFLFLLMLSFLKIFYCDDLNKFCKPLIKYTNKTFQQEDLMVFKTYRYLPIQYFEELIRRDFMIEDNMDVSVYDINGTMRYVIYQDGSFRDLKPQIPRPSVNKEESDEGDDDKGDASDENENDEESGMTTIGAHTDATEEPDGDAQGGQTTVGVPTDEDEEAGDDAEEDGETDDENARSKRQKKKKSRKNKLKKSLKPGRKKRAIDHHSDDNSKKNTVGGGLFKKTGEVFAGDTILTSEQKTYYEEQITSDKRGLADSDPYSRWPQGKVYYQIESDKNRTTNANMYRNVIHAAAERWMKYTCVNFIESDAPTRKDRLIYISSTAKNCYSAIGMIYDQQQSLTVGYQCPTETDVVHLLGHALGLYHEHTREDRDTYIVFHDKNIKASNRRYFKCPKQFSQQMTPYDFASVMHYSFFAFSKNTRMVFVPKNPLKEAEMYNSPKPSFQDYRIINIMYRCEARCKDTTFSCQNDGFKTGTAKGECICVCKPGFTGENCETNLNIVPCGGKFTSLSGKISNPHSIPFKPYRCVYWLQAPHGRHIAIQFTKFKLAGRDDEGRCVKEFLNVRNLGIYSDHPGRKFCDSELDHMWFRSRHNDLILVLNYGEDRQEANEPFHSEFSATYFAIY